MDASQSSVDTDIPGAHLEEPFEAHNVAALCWWLLCRGISVSSSLRYDQEFWEKDLLPKLEEIYNKCVAPEIISPVRVLGLPLRDLRRPSQ